MIATPERKKMVDFSYFVWTEPYTMVVPRPGEVPRLFALIWPFQPIVRAHIVVHCHYIGVSIIFKPKLLFIKLCAVIPMIIIGLAIHFHNHDGSGFRDESVYKNVFSKASDQQ
jgi:hypothetical protein